MRKYILLNSPSESRNLQLASDALSPSRRPAVPLSRCPAVPPTGVGLPWMPEMGQPSSAAILKRIYDVHSFVSNAVSPDCGLEACQTESSLQHCAQM